MAANFSSTARGANPLIWLAVVVQWFCSTIGGRPEEHGMGMPTLVAVDVSSVVQSGQDVRALAHGEG